MDIQQTLFDDLYEPLKIMKPIRLIELFAGYGSQSLALNYLGADYESHRICEWNYKSFHAYRLMHSIDVGVDYSEGHSDDEVLEFLIGSGVSADWNKPMTERQIRKLPLEKRREIYSDIIATHNLVDVSKAHARGLGMTDRDKYCYVMTYSFPCQDLSLSGKCLGMEKGSGTRSGLLWEVERILRECGDNRPDILLMENVTQVHGKRNDKDWQLWLNTLEALGYHSFWKDLIATDYGIPQTRVRCFMVSVRGNFCYTFPKSTHADVEPKLHDFLEDGVNEKYYLTSEQTSRIRAWDSRQGEKIDSGTVIGRIREHQSVRHDGTCTTLNTCEGGGRTPMVAEKAIPVIEATKKGYALAEEGDGVYFTNIKGKRGTVQHGMIQTIKTSPDTGVVVKEAPEDVSEESMSLKKAYCNSLIENHKVIENDVIDHSYSTDRRFNNVGRTVESHDEVPPLRTRPDTLGVVVKGLHQVAQLYPDSGNPQSSRIYDDRGKSPCLDTCTGGNRMPKIAIKDGTEPYEGLLSYDEYNKKVHDEGTIGTIQTDGSSPNHNWKVGDGLRIRKLTPRECFRLMGVRDEDFDRIKDGFSDSTLYHLAGDSIVVNVLMAIFGEML